VRLLTSSETRCPQDISSAGVSHNQIPVSSLEVSCNQTIWGEQKVVRQRGQTIGNQSGSISVGIDGGFGALDFSGEGFHDVSFSWVSGGEDILLCSFVETVENRIGGSKLSGFGHVVSFQVLPVHWVSRSTSTVGWIVAFSWCNSIGKIDSNSIRSHSSNIASKGSHVHLVRTSNGFMDPEPRAHASSVGASGKIGDFERLNLSGNTIVNNGEDDEIFRLHIQMVGFVGNSPGTSRNIFSSRCMDIGPGTVPGDWSISLVETSVSNRSEGFVGRNFGDSNSVCRKEKSSVRFGIVRRKVEVSVPPPIGKGEVLKGLGVGIRVHVPTVAVEGGGMPHGHMGDRRTHQEKGDKVTDSHLA